MRKTGFFNILIVFLLTIQSFQAESQVSSFPYTENFESGLGNWNNISGQTVNWRCGTGTAGRAGNICGPLSAQKGNYYAYVDVYNDKPSGEVAITQTFDFTNLTNPILSFYAYCYFGNLDVAYLEVSAKGSKDFEWVEIYRNFEDQGDDWYKVNACLSEFAGDSNVQIKIGVIPTNERYANVAIDNLSIEDFYVNVDVTDVTCYDYSDGKILITPSGAGPLYQYSIDHGLTYTNLDTRTTSYTFDKLYASGYPVAVLDVASNCIAHDNSVQISQPAEIELDIQTSDILCYGYETGEITITASESTGNNEPYYYSIDGGYPNSASNKFSSLKGGDYSVIVRNSKGCLTAAQDVSLGEDVLLTINKVETVDIAKCYGDKTGSVTVTASYGNNGPLDYSLDGGVTYHNGQNRFSSLSAGTYNLVVKDRNSCTLEYSDPIVLTQPDELVFGTTDIQDVDGCYGDENGQLNLSVSGGTSPYYYSLNNGISYQESNIFSSLSAGTYTPKIQDAMGCQVIGDAATISQPDPLSFVNVSLNDVETCFGDATGSIEITVTGGTGSLSYSLDGTDENLQSSNVFKNLPAGTYIPYVEDSKGCNTTYYEEELTQPTQFVLSSVTPISEGNLCNGDKNGQVYLFASGGTTPYYFTIDDFENSTSVNSPIIASINGLAAGSYVVKAKDANDCPSETYDIEITEPTQLVIDDIQITDVQCYATNTGYADFTVSGGTPNYSYGYSVSGENKYSYSASQTITGLNAGTYDFCVKDSRGCMAYSSDSYVVSEPDNLDFSSIRVYDVSTCYGDNTGAIDLNVKGGVAPYQYSIDGGQNFQSEYRFENLTSSSYYHPYVVDANGCKLDGVTTSVSEPSKLVITNIYYTEVKGCKGSDNGSIEFYADGGTGSLTYSIDSKTMQANDGTFYGLSAGVYNPMVYDSHGCKAETTPIEITEPDELVIDSVSVVNVECYGESNGSAIVYAHGGKVFQVNYPYEFYLNDDIVPSSYDGKFTYMEAGVYDFKIQDQYDCELTGSFTITQPDEFVISDIQKVDISTCYGDAIGEVSVSVKGGTSPLDYEIEGFECYKENSTGVFKNLPANSYSITVTDANKCTAVGYASIEQPTAISYSAKLTKSILCHDDGLAEIKISATGGIEPYKFSLDNGENFDYTDSVISNLSAGNYYVKASDANNCTQKYSISIPISNPSQVQLWAEATDLLCYTGNTGKITAMASGGTKPYLYSLDGENWQESSGLFKNLSDGVYKVYAKDYNECLVESDEMEVKRPDNLAGFTVSATEGCSPLQVTITQDNYGIANYEISNGDYIYDQTGPTNYTFENNTSIIQTYRLTASLMQVAGEGCYDTSSVLVTVYPQPEVDVRLATDSLVWPDNVIYFSNMNKNLESAHWDFGDGNTSDVIYETSHTYASCGNYNLIFNESDGRCTNSFEQSVVIAGRPLIASFSVDKKEGCQPVTVTFTNNSTNSDSCMWDFGDGTNPVYNKLQTEHEFTGAGTYQVSLTIYGDCDVQATTTRNIDVFTKPTAGFIQNLDTLYAGQNLKVESLNSSNDTYNWNFGDGTFGEGRTCDHKYQFDGDFTVSLIVTTDNNCSDTSIVKNSVTVISHPVVVFPTAFSPNGDGKNDVFKPIHGSVSSYELVVLNRLGVIVYRTNNIEEGWDGSRNGKPCGPGTYVWKSTSVLRDKTFLQQKGYVILLR